MYDIAVILINYNTSKYTLECIQSIVEKTSSSISYQIIVVDNNSEINDYDNLKNNFPDNNSISLHRSVINTGFGGGNMFGTQEARAKYLLFMNNDALLLNDALSILKNYMDNQPEVGLSSAQNYDEDHNLVPSFDYNKDLYRLVLGRGFLQKKNSKKYYNRKEKHTSPITVDWVNGAFLFFRAEAFNKIGGFDTNIFLYFEEMDLCHRLKLNSYKTVLVPSAEILHYKSVSTGTSKNIHIEAFISHLYVIKKHYGFVHYNTLRLYFILIFLFKPKKWFLIKYALKGQNLFDSLKQKQKIRPY